MSIAVKGEKEITKRLRMTEQDEEDKLREDFLKYYYRKKEEQKR